MKISSTTHHDVPTKSTLRNKKSSLEECPSTQPTASFVVNLQVTMSLLVRLFDRIGIDKASQTLLIEDDGITDLRDLSFRGSTPVGSALTNQRIRTAMAYLREAYLRENMKDVLDPEDVLDNLLGLEEWSQDSWEVFIFLRFDLAADGFEIMLDHSEAMGRMSFTGPSDTSSAESNKLSPADLQKIATKINNTNWECNMVTQEVDLRTNFDWGATAAGAILVDDGSDTEMEPLRVSLSVPFKVFKPLFPHQMRGIEFMLTNFLSGLDGLVLGDEMGLGKTRQALVTVMALMQIGHIKRALVLCPAPLITVWYNEVKTVLGGFVKLKGEFDVVEYSARTAKGRDYSLRQTRRKDKPLLVIASRDLVGGNVPRSKNPLFPTGKDTGLTWDWLIVDEAQSRARNPKTVLGDALRNKASKLTKGSFVLLLTATPISNNIEEFCNLLGLVSGRSKQFEGFCKRHKKAIRVGQRKNAACYEITRYDDLLEDLHAMAEGYVLQRSIRESMKGELPQKEEFAVWIRPSKAQWDASQRVLKSDMTERAKSTENRFCVFAVIQRLRMICSHPIFADQTTDTDIRNFLSSQEEQRKDEDLENFMASFENNCDSGVFKNYLSGTSTADILRDSPMLRVCKDLLVHLTGTGHKTLVFSLYRKPLDILQHVLDDAKVGFYRVDGLTSQTKRDKYIAEFNRKGSAHKVMLLTIQVGGVGLTLTGADRVILLGPSYNPSVDSQAVGRAYRITQKRPVKVYRLLMAGLIDEKVYGKQIQKEATIREVQTETGGRLPRYFDDEQLSELLTLGKQGHCEIMDGLPKRKIVDPAKLHVLGDHAKVHGIMHHDDVYRTFSNRYGDIRASKKRPADEGGSSPEAARSDRSKMVRVVQKVKTVIAEASIAKAADA